MSRNVLKLLNDNEYSCKTNERRKNNYRIIRNLMTAKDAKFIKIHEKHCSRKLTYEGNGRLYYNQDCSCYTLNQNEARLLYERPMCDVKEKVIESLICEVNMENPHELRDTRRSSRPCQYALKANNRLVRYDVDSGLLLESVFLAPLSRCKFLHIAWAKEGYQLELRSKQSNQYQQRESGVAGNVVQTIAILSVYPLEFVAMMEITKEVFGPTVTDVIVSVGLLITMHHGGVVRFHSFERLMSENLLFRAKLGEYVEGHGIVGDTSCGLPINLKLTERPPILLEVKCALHNVQFGGIPWHYIITPHGKEGIHHVHALENGYLAHGGVLDMDDVSIEPESATFHLDGSEKILHLGPKQVRVLKIGDKNPVTGQHQIKEYCTLKPTILAQSESAPPSITVTSSGRCIKRRFQPDQFNETTNEVYINSIDYEPCLEVISLIYVDRTEETGTKGRIDMFDNMTGQFLKTVQLQHPWKELYGHTVLIDMDTIIDIVKGPMSKFSCYVYRLDRRLDTTGAVKKTTKKKKRSK
ncbi:DDB1- and CUL4-associated factor 17-like [Tubulanus polymorphus]|uniref:DDB1- and CUL4-associated factor 17-like n=1 Tax=Tubulanus polymorphus TaxID=672921 RepID=UPI003DA61623